MAEITLDITGTEQLAQRLFHYADHLGDWMRFWPHAEEAFQRREQIWFDREGEGTWPALSPAYAATKQLTHPGRPKLVRDGTLRDVLTSDLSVISESPAELVMGTAVSGAIYHYRGTRRMPARDPIPPRERLAAGIAQRLRLWISWDQGIRVAA